jgi:hypothetical protein
MEPEDSLPHSQELSKCPYPEPDQHHMNTLLTPWALVRKRTILNRRLSAKLVPTSVDRGCHVVSVTDPYGRTLGFLDQHMNTLAKQNGYAYEKRR